MSDSRVVSYLLGRAAKLRSRSAEHRERAAAETDDAKWKPEATAAARIEDLALELERLAGDIGAGKHYGSGLEEQPPAVKPPSIGIPWRSDRG